MSLRARLLLALVGLLAAGLIVTDAVTYTQVRSFMIARIDPQLQVASYVVDRNLEFSNGLVVRAAGRPAGTRVPFTPPGGRVGATTQRPPGSLLAPTGTFGELVDKEGVRYGKALTTIYGAKAPPAPLLPHPLPPSGSTQAIFSSKSPAPNAVAYRVLIRSVPYRGLRAVVAIPLTDVNQTLGRLLLVEVLVSLVALAGLGVLARWVVRRGLRPLEHMAGTAGTIAAGDLGQRVSPADDKSEVGRLGIALNAMLGEIEQAFAARAPYEDRLRRFLADASHELRTPLTSIRGYAEIFDLGADRRPADLALSMHHIRDEAKRMGVLVDDLLLLARLDQERPLALQAEDIVAVVAKSLAAARVAAGPHEVVLDAPARLSVVCDPERVRRVVDNLVANALRHSPEGAPVEVAVGSVAGSVEISVSDHGPGIPPGEADRVFEPFFRADSSRARSTGGAGLGLAIVAAIAQAHGGSVGVRAGKGGGACVWIRLPGPAEQPALPPERPALARGAEPPEPPGSPELPGPRDPSGSPVAAVADATVPVATVADGPEVSPAPRA